MSPPNPNPHQIFIKSPNQTQTLTLTPTLTLSSLSPHHHPTISFSINGKPLNPLDPTPLISLIKPFSILSVNFKLLGGGGDGGATGAESRDCYLNMYAVKKPDKVDPNEKRLCKWTNCALSFEPLRPPCVVDGIGNVFNKEAIVRALIGKCLPKEFGHVKGLKDMIGIHLSVVPGMEGNEDGMRFQCPITGLEFNGKYKFIALRKCGHVLSVKALKEVKTKECLVCRVEFEEGDKIVINGDEGEVAVLRAKMEEEKAKARVKKAKKGKNEEVSVVDGEKGGDVGVDGSRLSGTKHGMVDVKEAEKRIASKVEVNGKLCNGGDVTKGSSEAPAKRFKAVDVAPASANKEVYASIFTSSRKTDLRETFSCRSLPLGRN